MAPFQYDTPSAPLAGSIADIIARGGLIQGEAATNIAQVNALATAQRGQMWGNVVNNIAQMPAQYHQQQRADALAQSQNDYRNMQMLQIGQQLQEHQQSINDQQTFNSAINELAPKYRKTDPTTNTTSWDYNGLADELRQRKVNPALTDAWMSRSQALDEARRKYTDAQIQDSTRITNELADIAYDSKTPENYAMNLRTRVQNGKVPAAVAQATLQQLNEQSDNYENFAAGLKGLAPAVATQRAALAKTQAETEKDLAAAAADRNKTPPRLPPDQEALDSYARALLGPTATGAQLSDAQRQVYDKRKAGLSSAAEFDKFVREEQYKRANPAPVDQNKLEQQYRQVLKGALSNRSGSIGLEDQKVQSANHLLALLDAGYDPKTDTYRIPPVMQSELALGLAKLMAPNGNVGIELMKELNQRTARGDMAGAWNYITGDTETGAPQKVLKMFKDSIKRQGEVASQNRQGGLEYLRGQVPTELEQSRKDALERAELNPLRQSRMGTDGKLYVSIDGGKTWQ